MPAFRPRPQHHPHLVIGFAEGPLGCAVPIVVCPTPNHGVEVAYHLPGGSLLVVVEVRLDAPQVLQHFGFRGLGEQFILEAAHFEPEKVEALIDVPNAGFRFAEL